MGKMLFILSLLLIPSTAYASKNGISIIIGNNIYEKNIPEVSYAKRDAEAFKHFVIDVLHFDKNRVFEFNNATLAEFNTVFGTENGSKGKIGNLVVPNKSNIIIYYSGHGYSDIKTKESYLLPYDADPDYIKESGYKLENLYKRLSKIKAKSIIVYIDACFSGQSANGALVKSASPVFITPKLPEPPNNLTIITAARNTEIASWDNKIQHGLFTEYTLQALYGKGDFNEDGMVTVLELKTWLDKTMTLEARKKFNREQHATVQTKNNDIVLSVFNPKLPPIRPYIKLDIQKKVNKVKKLSKEVKGGEIFSKELYIEPIYYSLTSNKFDNKRFLDGIVMSLAEDFSNITYHNVRTEGGCKNANLIKTKIKKIKTKKYKNSAAYGSMLTDDIFNLGIVNKRHEPPIYVKVTADVYLVATNGKDKIYKEASYSYDEEIYGGNTNHAKIRAVKGAFSEAVKQFIPYIPDTYENEEE